MHASTVYVFDRGQAFTVNVTLHPQVRGMLDAPLGSESRAIAWLAVCGMIATAVEAASAL
jgi:hypothetical protein